MEYFACGKLLLTAEYSVLRGALALALPTRYGQRLHIEKTQEDFCRWIGLNANGTPWLEVDFSVSLEIISTNNQDVAQKLMQLFTAARVQNPSFLAQPVLAKTHLEFDRNWGLGSSSTLVFLVAQWAQVDALKLFFNSFTGSGYDVATAMAAAPILYQLKGEEPCFERIEFSPHFTQNFYFIHLGHKQKSDVEVAKFGTKIVAQRDLKSISALTKEIANCRSESHFLELLEQHEKRTSHIIGVPTIKQQLFPAYPKLIKSLGAWGGDFILIHALKSDLDFFTSRGYKTIIPWKNMIA